MKSIRSRLVFYILIVSIIPVFAFLGYTVLFVSNGLIDTEIEANETKVLWANQYMEQVIDQLEDIMYSIHLEPNLLDLVDNSNNEYTDIEEITRSFLYTNSNILSKVSIISTNTYRGVSFDYENGFSSDQYLYDDFYISANDETHGLKFVFDGSNIVALHTINDFDTQDLKGIILLKLNSEVKDELQRIFGDDTNFVLYTNDDTLVDHNRSNTEISNPTETSNIVMLEEIEDDFVWTKRVSQLNLYVSLIVDGSDVRAFSRNMISVGVIIIILAFLISNVISLFFSRNITSPIITLTTHMNKNELNKVENLDENYEEISVLKNAYNTMIDEINTLINEKYRNEIERKNIQLKALQAQINPHFLSNTFQLIGGMALEKDAIDIYEATIKMSKLVRYSMRIEQEATTLKEELHHIKGYLEIQQLRFNDRLEFSVDVNNDILNVKIPKFTIQPIIENAFKYGLKKVDRQWKISLYSTLDDAIYLHISDNGKGMNQEKIDEINTMFKTGYVDKIVEKSIGLYNIHSRITLLYGVDYGLHITKNKDYGITVVIKIPNGGEAK